jgi:hypothetical protein
VERFTFIWAGHDYSEYLKPREKDVGAKVTFNSSDFNQYFQANLKQNCKYNYIPQAQADYVTDKYLKMLLTDSK